MKTLINKLILLSKIQENKNNHRQIFEEAIKKYREAAIKLLDKKIELLKKNKMPNLFIQLPLPTDHTCDYDRTIKMINMDTRIEIELTEEEFAKYVLDDWQWKREWISTASNYVNIPQEGVEE
jgi:ABC-type phosphate transport system substrate-binding protein